MKPKQPTPVGKPMTEADIWAYLSKVLAKYKGRCSNQQVLTSAN